MANLCNFVSFMVSSNQLRGATTLITNEVVPSSNFEALSKATAELPQDPLVYCKEAPEQHQTYSIVIVPNPCVHHSNLYSVAIDSLLVHLVDSSDDMGDRRYRLRGVFFLCQWLQAYDIIWPGVDNVRKFQETFKSEVGGFHTSSGEDLADKLLHYSNSIG